MDTDLSITGKIAQFGKSAIVVVSQKLLGQFVECLEAKLTAGQLAPSAASSDAVPATPGAPSAAPEPQVEAEPLDLMSVAGGAVYKRLIPLVAVVVVVVAVVIIAIVQ